MSEEAKDESMASMGGKARAAKMTAAERSKSAKNAAAVRWSGKVPLAAYGAPDRPLRLGDIEISCYVLSDNRRVIVQSGVIKALGMSQGTGRPGEGDRLAKFVTGNAISPYISSDLLAVIEKPIRFRIPNTGMLVYGYEATILADLCEAVLEARQHGRLQPQQKHIGIQCEILVRVFTKTGIVALVDEATGYQSTRESDALAKILEAFVAKELQSYMRTFEPDYYKAICQLKGWEYKTSSRRPRALAQITNDIVYARLAPGVLDELRKKNPVEKDGRRRSKHFQWLTDQKGHPELQKHLARVTGWMEMSQTWADFYKVLNERKPQYRGPTLFDNVPIDENEEA